MKKKTLSDSHAIRDEDSESNEFKTIDTKQLADLLDSPPPNKQEQLHCELSRRIPNVENSVRESVLVKLYDHAQHRNIALSDSVSDVIAASNEAKPRSFQIIGDNLDFHTNVKNQRLDKQGQDYHFFQMYAVQDEVSGDHLPDDPMSGCNLNDKVVGTFSRISMFSDFYSDAILTNILPHNLTIHMLSLK